MSNYLHVIIMLFDDKLTKEVFITPFLLKSGSFFLFFVSWFVVEKLL